MKSHSLITLASVILFLGMFIGFGLAAYEAYQAGDASHAIVPLLNCVLGVILAVSLSWQHYVSKKEADAENLFT